MKLVIESVGTYKDRVIEGIALTPTFSRNGNAYTPDVIDESQNLNIPLKADWEHTDELVGDVVYTLNPETHTIFYKARITDEKRAGEIKEGVHKVSIEARVSEVTKTCTRQRCYNTPLNLAFEGIGITTSPSVLTTTLSIIESDEFPKSEKKCKVCKEKDIGDCVQKMMDHGKNHDQAVAICLNEDDHAVDTPTDTAISKKDTNAILLELLLEQIKQLELKIQTKYEILKLYEELINRGVTDCVIVDAYEMCKSDLLSLGSWLINLRKDLSLVGGSQTFENTLKEIMGYKEVDVLSKLKERYLCTKCGLVKQVTSI